MKRQRLEGYRERLFNELAMRQKRNPAYSLRSFARDLDMSPTSLSQLFSKKRNLSFANLEKAYLRLGFSTSEIVAASREIKAPFKSASDEYFCALSDDVFRYMSDWYYFAILSIAVSGRAKADPIWIAKKFNITKIQAQTAIDRLKRLKLLTVRGGLLHPTKTRLRVPSNVPSVAARHLQHDHLHLAQISLETHPLDIRDMTSMTMLVTEDRIEQAKERIKKFRRKLSGYLEAGTGKKRVYVLAVQLFPVSEGGI